VPPDSYIVIPLISPKKNSKTQESKKDKQNDMITIRGRKPKQKYTHF